jgi:hypothetical protein
MSLNEIKAEILKHKGQHGSQDPAVCNHHQDPGIVSATLDSSSKKREESPLHIIQTLPALVIWHRSRRADTIGL